MNSKPKPELILPVGTHVVTLVAIAAQGQAAERRAGQVGKIIALPDDGEEYLIQFPDGQQVRLKRKDIGIRKQLQAVAFGIPESELEDRDLYKNIVYRCVVGSRAYGLSNSDSDLDVRGIYLPPADLHWSLYGLPEQIGKTDTDECFWEMQKFLTLTFWNVCTRQSC